MAWGGAARSYAGRWAGAPVLALVAVACAALVFVAPRGLAGAPAALAVGLAVVSLFRRERWPLLAVGAMALALAAFLLEVGPASPAPNVAALEDVRIARTIGGSLHARTVQFVCFDRADAVRGDLSGDQDSAQGDAARIELTRTGRCAFTDPSDGYERTADGRQRFVTPDGPVEVWAGRK